MNRICPDRVLFTHIWDRNPGGRVPGPGLIEAGVMNKKTMRAFDEMSLTPVEAM